jgi:hypothetical protein
VAADDTEGPDHQIDGLADGDASRAQSPVMASCNDRQLGIQHRLDREPAQSRFDARRFGFIPDPLQHLEQDDVADQQRLTAQQLQQAFDLGGAHAVEKVDPDRAVDDDH